MRRRASERTVWGETTITWTVASSSTFFRVLCSVHPLPLAASHRSGRKHEGDATGSNQIARHQGLLAEWMDRSRCRLSWHALGWSSSSSLRFRP